MKTTVEISEELLKRSHRIARREGTTLGALIEEGLRLALQVRAPKRSALLRVRPFKGDGLTSEYQNAGWDRIRADLYRRG